MEARFETLDELGSKRFYLQYRFPPSSVGEVGRVGGVNRREVKIASYICMYVVILLYFHVFSIVQ